MLYYTNIYSKYLILVPKLNIFHYRVITIRAKINLKPFLESEIHKDNIKKHNIYSLPPTLIAQFPNMAYGVKWLFSSGLCNYNVFQPINKKTPYAIFGNWTINVVGNM